MTTEKKEIYIGTSSRGASAEEKEVIAKQVKTICKLIEQRPGYSYFAEGGLKDVTVNKSRPKTPVPKEYYDFSDAMFSSISALRVDGDNSQDLRYDIAMCNWVDDLLSRAHGCIFIIGRSSLGVGIELFWALRVLQKQCLVLYSTENISSLVNGQKTRLLTVSRYNDETVERDVKEFLDKVETGLDRDLRFLVSVDTEMWMRKKAAELGFSGISDFARHILTQARTKNSI
jgi:hypothetical protein